MNAAQKYLAQWAEPEARTIGEGEKAEAAVVIPCTGEGESALIPVMQAQAQGALVIVVINARADAEEETVRANAKLARALAGLALPRVQILERTLPDKQGVGLARKIGCDLALALWHQGRVRSPFIFTTDADACLPTDYLARANGQTAGVLLYPFAHRLEAGFELAMQLYEVSLHYYVRALSWAGSSWAFHTLGSTIAIDAGVYAAIRGFPRRCAAEDFYLLAKAAKLAQVVALAGDPIVLAGRPSWRVPFGTGAALRRLQPEGFSLYDPEIFVHLQQWHGVLEHYVRSGNWLPLSPLTEAAAGPAKRALPETSNAAHRQRLARQTFDAFATLKFVHALRSHLPSPAWQEAVVRAPFMPALTGSLDDYRATLAAAPPVRGEGPRATNKTLPGCVEPLTASASTVKSPSASSAAISLAGRK